MVFKFNTLLDLYRLAATGHPNDLSEQFWGDIPSSFDQLKKKVAKNQDSMNLSSFEENVEKLRKIAYNHHRTLGTLTTDVKKTLEKIDSGFLDVGHQPLILGGSSFLINKVSLAEWLGRNSGIGTLFYIGDHDSIQNELTVTRFPQANSLSGLLITPHSWEVPDGTPIHRVPIPAEKWLSDSKVKIQENLRSLMKYSKVTPQNRSLLMERLTSCFDLIEDSTSATEDFSTWTQSIWSKLLNLRNKSEIFLISSSIVKFRELTRPAFEFLLVEQNRRKYIDTLNSIYQLLTEKGISPGLPHRESNYVPFFLECLSCPTKTRVELHVPDPGTLEGECPQCKEKFSFSYHPKHPDLSEIEKNITPRSDSRAMVNNITFPLLIHIGGGGETQYYASVIPAMKRLGVNPPILIRSNRIYYNTPWGEKSAADNNSHIFDQGVFKIFKEYNAGKNLIERTDALESMRNYLQDISMKNNKILLEYESSLKADPSNKKLRMQKRSLEQMLSHNYGRFAQGKNVQEVSWNWMDLGILTGIHKMTEIYQRQNNGNAFPGYTWYINPGKFN
ncbi:MAG: hypothetical protein ACTSRJ_00240 [Candidatus Hodarchaeales archaeon]